MKTKIKRNLLHSFRGHHCYTKAISPNSIVVDLGAHLAQFSHEISDNFNCKCYAVEALPSLYEQITETPLVKKFNYAISNTNAPIELCITDNPEANHIATYNTNNIQEVISVAGITLENFLNQQKIESIDLLKVDIEGSEINLFESLTDETISNIKQMTIEFHDFKFDIQNEIEVIKKRLKSLGFICIVFSGANNGDVLFINKHKCSMSLLDHIYIQYLARYIRGGLKIVKRTFPK